MAPTLKPETIALHGGQKPDPATTAHYWNSASLSVMNAVRQWRGEGLPVCYTVDAGPNMHVICPETEAQAVEKRLREIEGVSNGLVARAGGAAKIVNGE